MHNREWKRILGEINSARNLSYKDVIGKIKEELARKHLDVYKGWRIKKFDINHLFPLQSGYINNAYTLLHISARNDLRNIIKTLLAMEGININAVDSKYRTRPLHIAARDGHIEVVKILLENGAEVDALDDKHGITPLHLAARNGHAEVLEILLENGAGVNTMDDDLAVSLHASVRNGHVKVVKSLLKNRVNIDAINSNAETPLYVAARSSYVEILNILLENKAKVNVINRDEETPLHLAARNGHIIVLRALLAKGANAFLQDKNGHTPRDLAWDDGVKQILKRAERRQYLNSITKGVTIVCSVAAFQIAVVVIVSQRVTVAIPIKYIAFVIAVVTLASSIAAYAKLRPNTRVNEIQTVGVHYNLRNSEILII